MGKVLVLEKLKSVITMSEIRIDNTAFKHNLSVLRKKISTEIALVLKDNAYGHGILDIARLAAQEGVKSIFVKNYEEAKVVAPYFSWVSILYPDYANLPNKLPQNMVVSVNHLTNMDKLSEGTKIELKINTNTNRNGLDFNQLKEAINLAKQRNLFILGVFTHNGFSRDPDFARGVNQFKEVKKQTKSIVLGLQLPIPRFHSLSSQGALKLLENSDDLVRIGLAIYGYSPSLLTNLKLKPIASLWGRRISCKKLKKNSMIGYEGKTVLPYSGWVSTYDIGYGDGFPCLTCQDFYLPNGLKMFPRNSMDCFSTWGKRLELCVWKDANYVAQVFGWSVYEVLVRINPYIKRKIV